MLELYLREGKKKPKKKTEPDPSSCNYCGFDGNIALDNGPTLPNPSAFEVSMRKLILWVKAVFASGKVHRGGIGLLPSGRFVGRERAGGMNWFAEENLGILIFLAFGDSSKSWYHHQGLEGELGCPGVCSQPLASSSIIQEPSHQFPPQEGEEGDDARLGSHCPAPLWSKPGGFGNLGRTGLSRGSQSCVPTPALSVPRLPSPGYPGSHCPQPGPKQEDLGI